jgi:hypothetical protein
MLGFTEYTPIRFNISVWQKKYTNMKIEKTLCRDCGFAVKAKNKNIQFAEVSVSSGVEQPVL